MPRDPYPPKPGVGPDNAGPAPDTIYCPTCAAHLRGIKSNEQLPHDSHHYECEHGHTWEINRIPRKLAARNWNGARPNWDRGTGPKKKKPRST
jgi:hypothetical protein